MRIILSILLTGFLIAVDYETEIQPIFNANCIACHGGSGGLTLTSYSDLMGNAVVIPGNSAESQLIRKLRGTASGSQMPENQDPLDETTITLIETWIDEGALENEVYGCTDPEACNYDETATADEGSCDYGDYDGDGLCDDGDDDDDNDGCLDGVDDASFEWDDDYDSDGTPDDCDDDDDNDGAADGEDSDDNNEYICSDNDNDSCDDCSLGIYDVLNDGSDFDGDGICDAGDDTVGSEVTLNFSNATESSVDVLYYYISNDSLAGFHFSVNDVTLTGIINVVGDNFAFNNNVVICSPINPIPPAMDGLLLTLEFEPLYEGGEVSLSNIVFGNSSGSSIVINAPEPEVIPACENNDNDNICDVIDDCVVEDGASQECGCNTGIAEGACDCYGNVDLGCGCGTAGPSGCDETCGSTLENDECGVCDSDNGNDNACFTYPETFIGNWNYTINLYNNSECTGSPTYIFEQGITSFNADSSITVSGTTVQFNCGDNFTGSNYTLCDPYTCNDDADCEEYFPADDSDNVITCNADGYCVAPDAYSGLWGINDSLICVSFEIDDHGLGYYSCYNHNFSADELSMNVIIDSSSVAGEEYCRQISLVKDEIPGCTDSNACNYNPAANVNDESCIYVEANYDCNGNCTAEVDCADTCGGDAVVDACGVCDSDAGNDHACFTYPAEFISKWEGAWIEYSTPECGVDPEEPGEDIFFTFQNNGHFKVEYWDAKNGEYSCTAYPDCIVESEGLNGNCNENGHCEFQNITEGVWGVIDNEICIMQGGNGDATQSTDQLCGEFTFSDGGDFFTITTTGDTDSDCVIINLSRLKYTISIDNSTEIFDATSFVLNWRQGESIFETNFIEVVRDTVFQVGYQEPGSEPVATTTIVTPLFPTLGSKWSGMFSGPAHFEVQELTHIIVPADTALAYIYQIHNLSLEEYRGSMTFAEDIGILSIMQVIDGDTFSIVLESYTIENGNGIFPIAVGNEWVYVDGNYDDIQFQGCTEEEACNYVEYADIDDGSCEYSEQFYDCDGNCIVEIDCAEVCGGTAELDVCGVCGGNGYTDWACNDGASTCWNIVEGACDCDDNIDVGCGCNLPAPLSYCIDTDSDSLGAGDSTYYCVADLPIGWVEDCSDLEPDCTTNDIDECGVCGGNGPAEGFDCDGQPLSLFNGLIPKDFSIHSIYPNPFNPVTNIIYGLPEHVNVQILVYDLSGKQVETLINEFQTPGYHSVNWNADNLPSGVYLIRMDSGEFTQTQKVVLVK